MMKIQRPFAKIVFSSLAIDDFSGFSLTPHPSPLPTPTFAPSFPLLHVKFCQSGETMRPEGGSVRNMCPVICEGVCQDCFAKVGWGICAVLSRFPTLGLVLYICRAHRRVVGNWILHGIVAYSHVITVYPTTSEHAFLSPLTPP